MADSTPFLELSSDNAELLADWHAIAYDMQHVISSCNALIAALETPNADSTLVRSLWSSALIAYIRCFTSGRRARLDASIYSHLAGDPLGTHKYFKDARNKHIAHPVNAFEEVKIGVHVNDSKDILGLGHLAAFRICDELAGIANLIGLASSAIKYVEAKVLSLEQVILQDLKKDPEQVLLLKTLQIQPQGGAEAVQNPRG